MRAAEVVSPSTVAADRLLKPQLYAAAGVAWYVRLELTSPVPPEAIAYRLAGGAYVEHGRARPGQVLRLGTPVPAQLDPGTLLRRQAR